MTTFTTQDRQDAQRASPPIEVKKPNEETYLEIDQKDGLTRIRLCSYKEPVYLVIDSKIIPRLIEALQMSDINYNSIRSVSNPLPFTPEQLWPIVNEFFGKDMEIYYEFARAIERAHGIGE
jgi:hypothetical protein